jgi:hypothetical protein
MDQVPMLTVKDLTTMTEDRFLFWMLMVAIDSLDYSHFIQTGT